MSFIYGANGFIKVGTGGLVAQKTVLATGLVAGASAIWRGDEGVSLSGSDVVSWTDSVGGIVLNATLTPTVEISPGGVDAIGCLADDYLQKADGVGGLPIGNAPRTVFFVGRIVTDSGEWGGFTYGSPVARQGFGISVHGQNNTICLDTFQTILEGPSVNDGQFFIGCAVYNGVTMSLYLGKTLVGNQVIDLDTGNDQINLLKSWTMGSRNGMCGGVYVYPSAFSSSKINQMVDYLNTEWVNGSVVLPNLSNLSFVATSNSQGEISLDTDYQKGNIYVVLTNSTTKPNDTQIKNGFDHLGNPVPNLSITGLNQAGNIIRPIAGLAGSTNYIPHAIQVTEYNDPSSIITGTADTTDASPPPPSVSVDAVVSSASALVALLSSWSGTTNWNNTAAGLGKLTTDVRIIGIDTPILSAVTGQNLDFPQLVTIRGMGNFTSYNSSVYIQNIVNFSGSTNLRLYLLDLRDTGNSGSIGHVRFNNSTNCSIERCALQGVPFALMNGTVGTTNFGIHTTNSTNFTLKNIICRYYKQSPTKWFGIHQSLLVSGFMARHTGYDDHNVASNARLNDTIFEYVYGDRRHSKAVGVHNDYFQINKQGGMARITFRYCCPYRGQWYGADLVGGAANSYQGIFTIDETVNTGPHLIEQCLFINAQQRGHDSGKGNLTSRYNSFIDTDNAASGQRANAPFPRPVGPQFATSNFVVCQSAVSPVDAYEGTGGMRLDIGNDYSLLLPHMETWPTMDTDLWDIRPKITSPTHPDYAIAANRVGSYLFWEKLFNSDNNLVLSNVGWPTATMFVEDFDHGDNFGDGSYTGNFDADGNNF